VAPFWLKNKEPYYEWQLEKIVGYNKRNDGILLFYHKPLGSNVEIQAKLVEC
jgi:hypothetical protein